MSINEMIRNVNSLAIPGLEVPLAITVDEINEAVRNAMFEYFISTVASYGEVCGVPSIMSREFAVDFIKSNDYVEKYLRVTINLVLNGGFSNKSALDGFINRLLWAYVVIASHMFISSHEKYIKFWSLSETERKELHEHSLKQAMMDWNE